MLRSLYITNLAVIQSLEVDFERGMTVMTGETGAGKSILIDALGLVLGDRADLDLVRHGSDKAEVIADFDISSTPLAEAFLEEHELVDFGECQIRRVVATNGRSRAYINNRPVSRSLIRTLGQMLITVQGQHAHHALLDNKHQRVLLDAFADNGSLLLKLGNSFRQWKQAEEAADEVRNNYRQRMERIDLLRFQTEELQALALDQQSVEQLDLAHQKLASADDIKSACQSSVDRLYGAEQSIYQQLSQVVSELGQVMDKDPALKSHHEILSASLIDIQETSHELQSYEDHLEMDSGQLEELENRLSLVHDLARKHQVMPDQLADRLDELEQELNSLDAAGQSIESLEQAVETSLANYQVLAKKLSTRRQKAADKLSVGVMASMAQLGLPKGCFEVCLTQAENAGPNLNGLETVEYRISTNPGQQSKALTKVASGGELSRVSLGIQVNLAQQDEIPTQIFDEVDVGIGGATAEIVGNLLRELGQHRQVLCVTHQPQVAAQGHQHLHITKQQSSDSTETSVIAISESKRVEEIARMLGGVTITEQTLAHASEMLQAVNR